MYSERTKKALLKKLSKQHLDFEEEKVCFLAAVAYKNMGYSRDDFEDVCPASSNIWESAANSSYNANISYLLSKFPPPVTRSFIRLTEDPEEKKKKRVAKG